MSKKNITVNLTAHGCWIFLVFLILKLTHVIDWSWWWVTAPLWVGVVIVPVVFLLALIFAGGIAGIVSLFKK